MPQSETITETTAAIPSVADRIAADKAFDIAFRGDTANIDADMAQLFADEKADLLKALTVASESLCNLAEEAHPTIKVEMYEAVRLSRAAIAKAVAA